MSTQWRTLALATTGLNVVFLVWFSFAPFTGALREEFGLSLAAVGLLASAAVWGAPVGQAITGWCSDRFGATTVFPAVLGIVGVASVASAFATTYAVFFAARLAVSVAGTAFAVGIQHVSQWFPDERVGTATEIYAGVGNAGAAGSGLLLPRVFGADWRTAFLAVGVGTCGGIAFPLVLSDAAGVVGLHTGYLVLAALTLPVLAVLAWVFRPAVVRRANVAGVVDLGRLGPSAPEPHAREGSDD